MSWAVFRRRKAMKRVLIFFAEGFEEVEALTSVDFLRRAGIDVTTVGIGGSRINSAHNVEIKTDIQMKDFDEKTALGYDALIFPGGMPGAENISNDPAVNSLVKEFNRKSGLIAAICASPAVVLFPTGILEGRKVTCYPGFEERFDATVKHSLDRVVIDGNVITSRGPGTAAEFSIALIETLLSTAEADQIRKSTLQIF
jgi:4-methyl-5(b-hydroxyethyl)-thiazole monophosphate biosynthesis